MKSRLNATTLLFLSALFIPFNSADAHPFHSSVAEVEWNAETERFEVSLKVNPHDLELALRQRAGKRLILEKLTDNQPVYKYIDSMFQFHRGKEKLKFRPVGFEVDAKAAWIYFELTPPDDLGNLKISSSLLLDAPHQVNLISWKQGKKSFTLSLNEQRQHAELVWDAESKTFSLMATKSP